MEKISPIPATISTTSQRPARLDLWVMLTIALTALTSRFLFSHEFYLYEDDWYFYGTSINKCSGSVAQFLNYISGLIFSFQQGRPLGFAFPAAVACTIGQFGLAPIYLLGYAVFVGVCLLFFYIVRSMSDWRLALLAAVIVAIQPWDTTAAFYTHIVQVQMSTLCALAAARFAMHDRLLSLGGASLLTFFALNFYEGPAVIISLPVVYLFASGRMAHAFRLACVVALAFLIYGLLRIELHEARVAQSLGLDIGSVVPRNMVMLGKAALAIPGYMLRSLIQTNFSSVFVIALAATLVLAIIMFIQLRIDAPADDSVPEGRSNVAILIAASVLLVIGLLPFSLFGELWPNLGGRTGRYFSASIYGGAIIAAWLLLLLCRLPRGYVVFRASVVAGVFLCISYGLVIQRQLIAFGQDQIRIYYQMMKLIADIGPDVDVIFIAEDELNYDRNAAMYIYTWAIDDMPGYFFKGSLPRRTWIIGVPPTGSLKIEGDELVAGPDVRYQHDPLLPLRVGSIAVVAFNRDGARRLDSYVVDGRDVAKPGKPGSDAWESLPRTRFGDMFLERAIAESGFAR